MACIGGGDGEGSNQFLIFLANGEKQAITVYKVLKQC